MALDAPSTNRVESGRLPAADGLRALAATTVLAHHVFLTLRTPEGTLAPVPGPVQTGLSDLRWGVVLFFVLSGFLLFRPFAAAIVRGTQPPDIRRYLRNRALRILPAYWVVLLATGLVLGVAILRWPSEAGYLTDPGTLLANMLLLQNYAPETFATGIGPAWSLAVEAIFYLVLPVLAVAAGIALGRRSSVRARARAALLPAVVLLGLGVAAKIALAALLLVGIPAGWYSVAKLSFPVNADLFAPGMAAAVLYVLVTEGHIELTARRRRRLLAGATLCALLAVAWVGRKGPTHGELPDTLVACACAMALAAVLIPRVAGEAAPPSLALRALQWRPVVAVGLASYSVYLWHTPILMTLHRAGLRVDGPVELLGAGVLCAVLTGALSYLTYRFVEVPALARRRPADRRPATVAVESTRVPAGEVRATLAHLAPE